VQTLLRILGALPAPLRKALRRTLGGGAHQNHWSQTLWAWHFARGSKRLDRVAGPLCHWLAQTVGSVHGKTCLEFGSGHLLSEPLIFWLAGAEKVVACDYNRLCRPAFARRAFVHADRDVLRAALIEVAPPHVVDERLARLDALGRWTLPALESLGVAYRAPLSFAGSPPLPEAFDLIHSTAVLEHLPVDAATVILANLRIAMRPGATALHTIHLEDHRDFRGDPFAFLGRDTDWRPRDADSRGNRLRASDWLETFRADPDTTAEILWSLMRDDAPLPSPLDPRFAAYDESDLRTGSVLVSVRATT
jgi:hypothetical protein